MDPSILKVIVAVCVIFLTLVFFAIYRIGRTRRRGILLTGVCDSGKTLIFSRLIHNKFTTTYTSIKENTANYTTLNGSSLQLIDIPGHERLRNRILDIYKCSARALVYVIDSHTFQKEIKDVAEYLYSLLIDQDIMSSCKNILILCNKQDIPTSKDSNVIKTFLEKELNTVRETQSRRLSSIDGSDKRNASLGNPAIDFQFGHISFADIDFAESSALVSENDTSNLDSLIKWLKAVS